MAGFGKSTNGVSTFSVREILNLKEDSQKNIEAVSETERSVYEVDQHNEEKLEFRKVESEMEGKIDGDSGRFTKDNLDLDVQSVKIGIMSQTLFSFAGSITVYN